MLLIIAMIFSMTGNVFADEIKDNPGVSENTPVMPGAGAGAENPADTGTGSEDTAPEEAKTPSGDETVPEAPAEPEPGTDENVSDNGTEEPVSGDEIFPAEEEGTDLLEEAAGDAVTVSDDASIRAAVAAATTDPKTIVLTGDISLNGVLEIDSGKNITIDLKGHRISGKGTLLDGLKTKISTGASTAMTQVFKNKFLISVKGLDTKLNLTDSSGSNGSIINDTTDSDSVIVVWEKASLTAEKVTLKAYENKVAAQNALTAGGKAVMVVGGLGVGAASENSTATLNQGFKVEDGYLGLYAIGNGATIVANEGVEVRGRNTAIQNFGQKWTFGTNITVNGGTFTGLNDDSDAVYHAGDGTLRINGGTFRGAAGVEISNGKAFINGGDISSTAEFRNGLDKTYLYSGSTVVGCAVCYSPYTDSNLDSCLDITGGNISGAMGLFLNYRGGDANYYKTHIKVNIAGGSYTSVGKAGDAFSVSDNVPLGANMSTILKFTGGTFNTQPDKKYISTGYYAKKINDSRFDVVPVNSAYLYPKLATKHVLVGQTLGEVVKTVLRDAYGTEYEGTVVNGAAYISTNEAGTAPNTDLGESVSFNKPGTWYVASKKGAGALSVSCNGEDVTHEYSILNQTGSPLSVNQILKFTVEDVSGDRIVIEQIKPVYYSMPVSSVHDYFNIYYIHNGEKLLLTKDQKVDIKWGESEGSINSPAYVYDDKNAETRIWLKAAYLGTSQTASFMIERRPVYIVGSKEVTSLVGDELAERYYGTIKVYGTDEDGKMDEKEEVSVNDVRMEEWFDSTSSVIDLTGITNARKGDYRAVLKDCGRLNEKMSVNYELMEKAWITYSVRASLILDFMDPARETELTSTKIRRADDRTPLLIYSFSNKQSTLSASWCVKTVSYDRIEQCWNEEMVGVEELGVTTTPIANNMGTRFEFGNEFLNGISENGARYTFYEIFKEDMTYKDKGNLSLTVKAVAPVVYNGNKFVAKDDAAYYSRGIPKSGYSPILDISVWDGSNKLIIGTDYTLSYKNNKNAGNKDSDKVPMVVVTGKGIYSEMKINVPITILAADLSRAANVSMTTQYVKYNGKALSPKLKVFYRSGANAGKEIPASAYDITILDSEKKDVTAKKFKKNSGFERYTAVITANGSNPNITGSISQVVKEIDDAGNETKDDIFFYGIPKSAAKLTVGGTLAKVTYPLPESAEGIESFIDKDKFYAKNSDRKFFYEDVENGSVSIDLVDSMDECVAGVYDPKDKDTLNSGVYYLKVQLATEELKFKYYTFEPTYKKVTYAGTKLNTNDVKLKKKSFDFSSEDESTPLTVKVSNRLVNKGMEGVRLYVYQNGKILELTEVAENAYVIPGEELENNKAGRYRIRVEGTGSYYGGYDLTYTIGVQAYNKDTTPIAAFVNTATDSPDDETERAVPYRPDGKYPDEYVKVVWTKSNNEKVVLKPRTVSGGNVITGDYYVIWGTFKQVGPKKGTVTIVGTGTYFTGKIKKKFDVTQAE